MLTVCDILLHILPRSNKNYWTIWVIVYSSISSLKACTSVKQAINFKALISDTVIYLKNICVQKFSVCLSLSACIVLTFTGTVVFPHV